MSSHNSLPKIAVLMAVHNGIQWLDLQVQSILHQENVDVHLFINVDKSQDGSDKWCESLAQQEPKVTLLPNGQRFGSATKNFLHLLNNIDFSDFDYVSFSDQDDIWNLDKLQRACVLLQQNHYQAYSSNVTAWWEDGRENLLNKAQPLKSWDYLFESGGPGCTYVLSKPLAEKIRHNLQSMPHLSEQLKYHDWFFYAFTRAKKIPWYIDPKPSMLYRQHFKNAIGINQGWRAFLNRAKHTLSGSAFTQSSLTYQILFSESTLHTELKIPVSRWGFIKLSLRAPQCRRRLRDQFYFFCLCILIAFIGPRDNSNTL